ncbi:MAG: hypothetical protein AB1760_00035 [Pseudomonadota bacterium]
MAKHPNDMNREELRELVSAMGSLALDLAQHLRFSCEVLKPEYQAEAYARATQMAYDLAFYAYNENREEVGPNCIMVLGKDGVEFHHPSSEKLMADVKAALENEEE